MIFPADKSLDEIGKTSGLGTRFYMSRVFKKTPASPPPPTAANIGDRHLVLEPLGKTG